MKKNHNISVVIPIYNEEENLPNLTKRLVDVLCRYAQFEILYVDDGSKDRSVEIITAQAKQHPSIKLLKLSRNFGHQEAITAGLAHCSGDAVIVMDGDLQDPPEVLPLFIEKWQEGYEVVYAIREKRKEHIFKKIAYYIFYRLMRYLSNIEIPLDSGDFSLMDRKVVDLLNKIPEKNRFIRGIRSWLGFRQTGIAYERHARFAGVPKYNLTKLFLLAYNGLTSFSTRPVKVATHIGLLFTGVSFFGIVWLLYHKLILKTEVIEGWASTLFAVLFLSGVQLIIMGIQGEYIARIFIEVKNRPNYIIGETIGIEPKRKNEDIKEAS